MKKENKKEIKEEVVDEVVEEEVVENKTTSKEVSVFQGKTLVRVYSEVEHGKDFMKLAKGFVEKYAKRGYRLE